MTLKTLAATAAPGLPLLLAACLLAACGGHGDNPEAREYMCAEGDRLPFEVPVLERQYRCCDNGIDDNNDGFADAADPDCWAVIERWEAQESDNSNAGNNSGGANTDNGGNVSVGDGDSNTTPNEICDNGSDDNNDGRIDCDDPQCENTSYCQGLSDEVCTNGVDDDGDGRIDTDDSQCYEEVVATISATVQNYSCESFAVVAYTEIGNVYNQSNLDPCAGESPAELIRAQVRGYDECLVLWVYSWALHVETDNHGAQVWDKSLGMSPTPNPSIGATKTLSAYETWTATPSGNERGWYAMRTCGFGN